MTKAPKHGEPRSERHEHHIHQEKNKWEWALEVAIGLMVLGTLAATSVAAYWTGEQWSVSNQQLRVMDDQEKRQLRAYVGIPFASAEVLNFAVGQKPSFKIMRRNYGQTPAYEVGPATILGKVLKWPFVIASQNEGCGKPTFDRLVTMFPQADLPMTVNFDQILTEAEFNDVKAGKSARVWYGNFCYRDAFTATHNTNYCLFYRGGDDGILRIDACLQHNDSD